MFKIHTVKSILRGKIGMKNIIKLTRFFNIYIQLYFPPSYLYPLDEPKSQRAGLCLPCFLLCVLLSSGHRASLSDYFKLLLLIFFKSRLYILILCFLKCDPLTSYFRPTLGLAKNACRFLASSPGWGLWKWAFL